VEVSAKSFGTEAKGQEPGDDQHNAAYVLNLARIYPSSQLSFIIMPPVAVLWSFLLGIKTNQAAPAALLKLVMGLVGAYYTDCQSSGECLYGIRPGVPIEMAS
jgi:hypothetical protein